MEHARKKYGVSERYACRVLKLSRGTQPHLPLRRSDEDALTRGAESARRTASARELLAERWIVRQVAARSVRITFGATTSHDGRTLHGA